MFRPAVGTSVHSPGVGGEGQVPLEPASPGQSRAPECPHPELALHEAEGASPDTAFIELSPRFKDTSQRVTDYFLAACLFGSLLTSLATLRYSLGLCSLSTHTSLNVFLELLSQKSV